MKSTNVLWVALGLCVASTGCEAIVNLDPALADASIIDACPICADVSADADYDAPDVSIYGVQPAVDAGLFPRTSDAGGDAR